MMGRVHNQLIDRENPMQASPGHDRHAMVSEWLPTMDYFLPDLRGDVLNQGATCDDVRHLCAQANPQEGFPRNRAKCG